MFSLRDNVRVNQFFCQRGGGAAGAPAYQGGGVAPATPPLQAKANWRGVPPGRCEQTRPGRRHQPYYENALRLRRAGNPVASGLGAIRPQYLNLC